MISLIKLGRLPLIISTLILFFLGALLAVVGGNEFNLSRFILGLCIVTIALLSMSYANNYYDAESDQYNKQTLFSGGSGDLLQNKKLYNFLKPFSLALMGVSIILSLIFLVVFSFPLGFLLYVIVGNLLAWYYTAPPLKFAYRGLGEIITVIAVGLMIPGLGYFVLAKQIDSFFLVFIVPFMLYILIFIINAEIPDAEGDRKGNKKTVIVRKGHRFGLYVAGVLVVLVVLYFFILSITNLLPAVIDFRLITLFSLVPFIFVMMSIPKRFARRMGTIRLVKNNISSILFFILMVNCYLLYLIVSK
ncbi:MAG: prenyltransferase [Thermoplasmatales archaeon]|nr:MAG: prenyltransferase [Thermoplasmatales archaeon]